MLISSLFLLNSIQRSSGDYKERVDTVKVRVQLKKLEVWPLCIHLGALIIQVTFKEVRKPLCSLKDTLAHETHKNQRLLPHM